MILPLEGLEGLGPAADLVLVGLSVPVDQQLVSMRLILGIVELKLAVLPARLEAPPVLQDGLLAVLVLVGDDDLCEEEVFGGAGGVELLHDDQAALVVGLHLGHLGLYQLVLLVCNVALEQLSPIYLDRVFAELPQLDLGSLMQHEFYLKVLAKQEHVLEIGVGFLDDLQDE